MRADPGALRRGRRDLAREGIEFGVLDRDARGRRPGAHAAGPGRRVRRDLPAAARRAPGAERGRRAGRGRGVPRRGRGHRQLDLEVVREGFAAATSPGPAGAGAHRADDPARRGAQPARHGGHRHRAAARSSRSAGWSGGRGARRQGRGRHARAAGAGRRRDRRAPATRRPGRCRPTSSATLAVEVFGEDRVQVEPRCRTRSRPRSRWPSPMWTASSPGSAMLITGSVVTVADARRLLVR